MVSGKVIGFTCSFITNSPFAWTELITHKFTVEEEATFTLSVNTSERYREIFPVITILPSISENDKYADVTITNHTDRNKSLSLHLLLDETTIDCRRSKIYSEAGLLTFEDLGLSDTSYIYWPRLYYGDNEFTVTGNTDITFKWREPRKVGAY